MSKILLVEPNFPIPPKSRNHKNFLPIGLLKIATYLRDHGHQVKLIRGCPGNLSELGEINEFNPDQVWITSLFTYWAKYVRESVQFYRKAFPRVHIKVGGIYASLLPPEEVKEYTGCDEVCQGVIKEVEEYAKSNPPAYDLLGNANPHPINFQVVHASRGCRRKCPFYPYVESILDELIGLRREGKVKWVESQSGFDGRVLLQKPRLARMIMQAGFRYPRIAWDWGYDQNGFIEKQIQVLLRAGYKSRDIFVFMLYNHQIPFEEMEKKRIQCWKWQVQIADCRFRPLNQLVDNYNPHSTGQTSEDYFISDGWSDALVKQFRRNVRRQNICVRMRYPLYSAAAERKRVEKDALSKLREIETVEEKKAFLESLGADWWTPGRVSYPEGYVHQSGSDSPAVSGEGHRA